MIGLLRLLRDHADAVEADLARYYNLDYRDRWNPDPSKRLTLRRLYVLVWKYPPVEGSVVLAQHGRRPWNRSEHLLDEVRMAIQASAAGLGSKHPKPIEDRAAEVREARQARAVTPERRRVLTDARRRRRQRQQDIAEGRIT